MVSAHPENTAERRMAPALQIPAGVPNRHPFTPNNNQALVIRRFVDIPDLHARADLEGGAGVPVRFVFREEVDIVQAVRPDTQGVGAGALAAEIVAWAELAYKYVIHAPRGKYLYS